MALQQISIVDLIQIDEIGSIMIRQRTDIFDDVSPNIILASNYHRSSFTPGQDLTGQPSNVIAIANTTWTPEVISAYQESLKPTLATISTGA